MTNPTLSNNSHSSNDDHHTEHDTYGDKLVWLPALGVILAGLGMYNLLKQELVLGFIFGGSFFALLMIYFFYRATQPPHPDFVPERNLQMWGFLASEVIFFTGIIGLSLLVRVRENILERFWGAPGEYLDILLTAVNTFILICSSLTMVLAQDSIKKGDYRKFKLYILATFVIGAIFLSIQLFEYNALMTHHLEPALVQNSNVFTPEHSLYAATFFLQTGFHGFHVTIGLVALLGVLIASVKGKFTKENHTGIELMGLYWHFIDLVWIVLFAVVYLI
ncbi:MAG: Cytochrome c oxidase subunit 3 [Candidatus Heimdallarchaeota archaeon LC_3]|nr:MAG: Cytochrome c oxidase subunit 3 [Candidatus Heimdallarchaeota archaeon LC_3]